MEFHDRVLKMEANVGGADGLREGSNSRWKVQIGDRRARMDQRRVHTGKKG
jgi:hypothetical protein